MLQRVLMVGNLVHDEIISIQIMAFLPFGLNYLQIILPSIKTIMSNFLPKAGVFCCELFACSITCIFLQSLARVLPSLSMPGKVALFCIMCTKKLFRGLLAPDFNITLKMCRSSTPNAITAHFSKFSSN